MSQRVLGWSSVVAAAVLLGGCASVPEPDEAGESPRRIALFSQGQANGKLPAGWQPWRLSKLKRLTRYELVDYNGTVVVKAMSAASASGLVHPLDLDPREYPVLRWRWKVPQLIAGADNHSRSREDSPVRIVVSFDGDMESLSFEDRAFMDRIRAVTGHRMPYATLMYIWENRAQKGQVIPNPHTGRIRMIVAESGPAMTGTWKLESQNVYEDYVRAFREPPGRIKAIAIMTDTDNTGASVEAYYGDITFERARGAAPGGPRAAPPRTATAP
ncbi:MAG: DUF3047 domain-containing protein [Burkholderiales bacterium]|nr:DUF3047 domain-containing protein [Burkholderiales bacterium]